MFFVDELVWLYCCPSTSLPYVSRDLARITPTTISLKTPSPFILQFSVDLGLRPLDMLSLGGSTSTKAKENMENQHNTRGRVRPTSAK